MEKKSELTVRDSTRGICLLLEEKNIEFCLVASKYSDIKMDEIAGIFNISQSQVVKCVLGKDCSDTLHAMLVPQDSIVRLKQARRESKCAFQLLNKEELGSYNITEGAVSPLKLVADCLNVKFYMDESLFDNKLVGLSSGDPRAAIALNPLAVARFLNAKPCNIAKPVCLTQLRRE